MFIEGMPLLLLFILLVATLACFFERYRQLILLERSSQQLVYDLAPYLEESNWKEVHQRCRQEQGGFAEVIEAGLKKHLHGKEVMASAMQSEGMLLVADLERPIQMLSLFVQIAPLIGFFGVIVWGMQLLSQDLGFDQLRMKMHGALLPAALGLITAIVAALAYFLLMQRIQRCSIRMQMAALAVLNRLEEAETQ